MGKPSNTPASPFSGLTQDQGSPLEGLDLSPPAETNLNNDSANRTARLSALVNTDVSDPTVALRDEIEKNTQKNLSLIKRYGDLSLRREAAVNQVAGKVLDFQAVVNSSSESTDPDGSLRDGAELASQAMLNQDLDQRAQYALEQQAVERIQNLAGSDPVQALLLEHNLQDGDSNQIIRDMNTKQLILQREIENAGVNVDDQSIIADFADFVMGTAQSIGTFTRGDIGNVDLDGAAKSWYDSLLSGDRKQAETSSLWNMPLEEFGAYVKDHLLPNIQSNSTFLGYKNNSSVVSTLTNLAHPGPKSTANLSDMVNNIGLVVGVKPLRMAVSIPALLVRNGARRTAVDAVSSAMQDVLKEGSAAATEKSGIPMGEITRAISPSALNTSDIPVSTVPIAADANDAFARGQALLAEVTNLVQPGRFTSKKELEEVLQKNIARITDQFSANATVKDVIPQVVKLGTGQELTNLVVTLGKKTGGGFASQEEAEGFARSIGLPSGSSVEVPYPRVEDADLESLNRLDWESVVDDSGQWFINHTTQMKETGLYTSPLSPQAKGWLSGYLLRARHVGDEWLADLAQVSGNTRQRITTALKSKLKSINSMSQNELSSLGQVLHSGIQNKVWLSDSELSSVYERSFNRLPSSKEISSYHDYRDLSDMDFALRNDTVYNKLYLQGYKSVSIHTPMVGESRVNALVDREMKDVSGPVWDAVNNQYAKSLSEEEVKALRDQGGVLVRLQKPTKLSDGTWVNKVIAKGKDITEESLRRDQLGYIPGGRVLYRGQFFVKQAKELAQPGGKKFLVNPKTFLAGDTYAEANAWVQKMETARLLVKTGENREVTFDKLFKGDPGYPSGKEFLQGVSDGTYSEEHPFEVVDDRRLPAQYYEQGKNLEFVDSDNEAGLTGLMQAQGKSYFSPRGEAPLRDFRGDLAPTLDAFQTLNRSLSNISKLTSFADYKQAAVERWANTFRGYTSLAAETSDWRVFNSGVISKDVPYRIRQAAENQRKVINSVLGTVSDYDYHSRQYARSLAQWVGGDNPNGLANSLARGVLWWSKNTRPLDSVRGLVFDAKMGFWNPIQVPIHLGNSYAALTMAPLGQGMNALKNAWFARSFLTEAGTTEWLDDMVSRGTWKTLGYKSSDDFRAYMNYIKDSGMMNITDANNMVNKFGPSASISAFQNSQQSVRESGRLLLHGTWQFNKIIASSLAWQELREKFPSMLVDSSEFLNKFAGRTEEYDFNFARESRAAWQKGWTSIPTQFFGYWTSLLEAVVGKQFTTSQKIRLALGQLFLGGLSGAPIIGAADLLYQAKGGVSEQAHPDTFWGGLQRGALDEVIYGITGADVKAGARIGVGDELTNIVQDLFGFGEGADKSFMDVAGGASYSTAKQFSNNIAQIIRHSSMETGENSGIEIGRDTILGLANNINAISNITKAYSIFKYGTIISASGSVLASDVPTAEGWAQALGFQPYEQTYMQNLMSYSKDSKAVVNDAMTVLQNYRTRFATEPDNREELSAQINAFMMTLPVDVRQKALRRMRTETPKAIYQSLSDQIKREQQEKAIVQDIQQDNQ